MQRFRSFKPQIVTLAACLTSPLLGMAVCPSALAQTISESQMRAANLARMQAELINGGVGKYSAANCMHKGGGGNCLVSKSSAGFVFRFLGGTPGWTNKKQAPTIESEVFVSENGKTIRMEYNGAVRYKAP